MVEVWHIRHGESEANAGLATENPPDVALTKLGHDQAYKTSLAFKQPPTLIVTSKYKRAMQTAQYTMDRFPNVPVETWDVHEFTYLSYAVIGKTTMQERRPIVQAYWERSDPAYIHGEDAESFEGFIHRIKKTEEQILAKEDQFIAIFSHGFVMKAILWAHLLGSFEAITMDNFHTFQKSFDMPNCAIFQAEYRSEATLFSGLSTVHLK